VLGRPLDTFMVTAFGSCVKWPLNIVSSVVWYFMSLW